MGRLWWVGSLVAVEWLETVADEMTMVEVTWPGLSAVEVMMVMM